MFYIILVLLTIVFIPLSVFIYQRIKSFGSIKLTNHKKKGILQRSKHYKNGVFHNQLPVQQMADGVGIKKMFWKLIKGKPSRAIPKHSLPNLPFPIIDLKIDQFIWFGHSSYLLVLNGKTFLIDPVFSKSVSPLGIGLDAFKMNYKYSSKDLPNIDYLIITHDHWDHLDYRTIREIKPKVKQIITGLGVGAHFEKWGFTNAIITELDWWENFSFDGFNITSTPAQHFAGRGFKRNITLWSSFVLESQTLTIYLGGDSGYGPHFKEIGEKFAIDWAFLENGQYDQYWPAIHMHPIECISAGNDLNTRFMIPIHNSKFSLAFHDWDAPLRNVFDFKDSAKFQLMTPMIGEIVNLSNPAFSDKNWWNI